MVVALSTIMIRNCKPGIDPPKMPCQTKWRLFLTTTILLGVIGLGLLALAQTETPSPDSSIGLAQPASPAESPSPLPVYSLAPYEERLAAAQSVKVMTSILGLELGSTLEQAHAKLDKLSDPKHPPKEEEEGSETKILWQIAKTDYSAIFMKAGAEKKITYLNAILRPGKEIPFEKIGETKKAPVYGANTIAWDVIRPNRPLSRVVATGVDQKANNITMFVVKRPAHEPVEKAAGTAKPDR
jgi:hypothetical protein